jgi:predicted  nucleic acid-binding Zn-ribbon protein
MPRISSKPVDRKDKAAVQALRSEIKSYKADMSELHTQARALNKELKGIEKLIASKASAVEKLQSRLA